MLLGGMKGEVPEEEYFIPFGQAHVRREGTDVTVVALAKMVHEALEAADELAEEGISVEVIDPRTLVPLDTRDHPASRCARPAAWSSWTKPARPAARPPRSSRWSPATRATFAQLKAAPARVCGLDVPIPFSPPMEQFAIPDKAKIVEAVRGVMRSSKPS